jgi:penicillin-binding protein 2
MLLAACSPQPGSSGVREIVLPTYAQLPTPEIDLDAALRASLAFLSAWQNQDFPLMYSLISYRSQEAITLDDFERVYRDAQNTMTIAGLTFQEQTFARMAARTAQLVYDVTFQTNILGEFSDPNRTLTVIQDADDQWRVAWSTSDIIPELGIGARLEFEARVPSRANIYDRNGNVLADMEGVMVVVFVVQQKVDDWETCANLLAETTAQPRARIDTIFANAQPSWTTRVGVMEPATYRAQQSQLEQDCEATFEGMPVRRYPLPYGSQMPHILGSVGYPNPDQVDDLVRLGFNAETIVGQSGIEQRWDETLRGKPGGRLSVFAPDGTRLRVLAETTSQVPESLWLTIDGPLQQYVQQALGEAYVANLTYGSGTPSWGSTSPGASAVVLDVRTGEILAMVSYPYYDANAYNPFPAIGLETARQIQQDVANDPHTPQLNRAAQGVYPTGSVFKVVDSVAVLDSGVYLPEQAYSCSGIWSFEGDNRYDWLAGGHGRVTTRSAIMQSCNPFFYQVGFMLNQTDPWILPNYTRRMGLGALTGLTDIPEEAGLVPDPDYIRQTYGWEWNYSNAVNLAIGQGEIQATPLQMVRLYAGIANGGNLMRPYLVRERGILDQRTFVAEPEILSNFEVAPEVLELVRAGMCDVVTARSGTAWHIFNLPQPSPLLDIGVCGKTGTAQAPGDGALPHSWFAAYAPADNPQIAIVVMVENAGDGSAVAAPITERILEYYFFLREGAQQ